MFIEIKYSENFVELNLLFNVEIIKHSRLAKIACQYLYPS